MIIDAVLEFFLLVPKWFLGSASFLNHLVIPEGVAEWWSNMLNTLTYFLPVKQLMPIIYCSLAVKGFQIGWALFLKFKSLIPFFSD